MTAQEAIYPWSGQEACFGDDGRELPCAGTGQEAAFRPGRPWPTPRFAVLAEGLVEDRLTGLSWTRQANPAGWPLSLAEAQAFVSSLNASGYLGRTDWRVPRRRELLSLVSLAHARPALPPGHPFADVFQHWCWTSSPSAVARGHVWRIHLEGGRMFSGPATASHLVWPVAGNSWLAPEHAAQGLATGRPWPHPRFQTRGEQTLDRLTGLVWRTAALPGDRDVNWTEALDLAAGSGPGWRLPGIWELESLTDASRAWPALPQGHPFSGLAPERADAPAREEDGTDDLSGARSGLGLWSSTSSGYDPAWAWVLYTGKGAVGVGYKPGAAFRCLLTKGLAA